MHVSKILYVISWQNRDVEDFILNNLSHLSYYVNMSKTRNMVTVYNKICGNTV